MIGQPESRKYIRTTVSPRFMFIYSNFNIKRRYYMSKYDREKKENRKIFDKKRENLSIKNRIAYTIRHKIRGDLVIIKIDKNDFK